jgi:NADH-quinone oxidoreductase subunit N
VVSAFYYVRVLKAMFLRPAEGQPMNAPPTSVVLPIVLATAVVVGLGVYPSGVVNAMRSMAIPMLSPDSAMAQQERFRSMTGPPVVPIPFELRSKPNLRAAGPGGTPPPPPPAEPSKKEAEPPPEKN